MYYASGGDDKLVRVWKYDEGMCYYMGEGHAGGIVRMAISPDQKNLVSVGTDGSMFIWQLPKEVVEAKQESDLPTLNEKKK